CPATSGSQPHSSTARSGGTLGSRGGHGAGPWTCPQHLRGKLVADEALRRWSCVDHGGKVDAGRHAHVLDHVHEFLGGNVARCPRWVGGATKAANPRTKPPHPD